MKSIEAVSAYLEEPDEADARIRLLGELEITRGGRPLSLPASKRTRALLGYLVACNAPQSREHLCDLLWENSGDPRAQRRWSLTKLRPVVNGPSQPRLEADRERVRFTRRAAIIDVAQITEILADGVDRTPREALEEAAILLEGEFL